MKVTEITIQLQPSENEEAKPRTLARGLDKKWTAYNTGDTEDGGVGMFPHEIRLANSVQEAIKTFTS